MILHTDPINPVTIAQHHITSVFWVGDGFESRPSNASYAKTLKMVLTAALSDAQHNQFEQGNALGQNRRSTLPCTFRIYRQMSSIKELVICRSIDRAFMHIISKLLVLVLHQNKIQCCIPLIFFKMCKMGVCVYSKMRCKYKFTPPSTTPLCLCLCMVFIFMFIL